MTENKVEIYGMGWDDRYIDIHDYASSGFRMEGFEEQRFYVVGSNDEPMTFKGISIVPDEDESLEEEYLRLREQTEFAGECTVSPRFIRQMQMAIGVYWKGKVPRIRGDRLWWNESNRLII